MKIIRYLIKTLSNAMPVFDTNILVYAVDVDSEFHEICSNFLEESSRNSTPVFLTWGICYEFLRVVSHPNILSHSKSPQEAVHILEDLIYASGFRVLEPTPRHIVVLSEILEELPDITGNIAHDLHTAALMREHEVTEIYTHDRDFYRFPFLTVIDPVN